MTHSTCFRWNQRATSFSAIMTLAFFFGPPRSPPLHRNSLGSSQMTPGLNNGITSHLSNDIHLNPNPTNIRSTCICQSLNAHQLKSKTSNVITTSKNNYGITWAWWDRVCCGAAESFYVFHMAENRNTKKEITRPCPRRSACVSEDQSECRVKFARALGDTREYGKRGRGTHTHSGVCPSTCTYNQPKTFINEVK